MAAAKVGSYALFAGGYNASNTPVNTVDAYNTSLTRSTPTILSVARGGLAAANVGSYALFAGGSDSSGSRVSTVDAYDTSLTRSTPPVLSIARTYLTATAVGTCAFFAGGLDSSTDSNVVDMYTTSLTRSSTTLSQKRSQLASTSINDTAIFGGGLTRTMIQTTYSSTVNSYTLPASGQLFADRPTGLSVARAHLAATSVGNYALFAGGIGGDPPDASSAVDAYYII